MDKLPVLHAGYKVTILDYGCLTKILMPDVIIKIGRKLIFAAILLQMSLAYGAVACEGVISNRTGSEDPRNFVAGSYLILFNDPAIGVERVVLPPDPARKGT